MFNDLLGEFSNIGTFTGYINPSCRQQYSYWGMIQSRIKHWPPTSHDQKEPLTFLGRCTTLANRDGHYKRYNRNKAGSKITNTKTDTARRNPSTCHFHCKHHQICYSGKQVEEKRSGCSSKGQPRYEHIIKCHMFTHNTLGSTKYMLMHTPYLLVKGIASHICNKWQCTVDYVDATTTNMLSPGVLPS